MKKIIIALLLFLYYLNSNAIDSLKLLSSMNLEYPDIRLYNIDKLEEYYYNDSICIYKLSITKKENLVSNMVGEYSLLLVKDSIYLLGKYRDIEIIYLNTNKLLIGGINQQSNIKGNYHFYEFEKCQLKLIYKTEAIIFDKSLECISYCDFFLKLSLIKISDYKIKATFSGYKCTFCDGLERGYNYKNRQPLHKEFLEFIYIIEIKNKKIVIDKG